MISINMLRTTASRVATRVTMSPQTMGSAAVSNHIRHFVATPQSQEKKEEVQRNYEKKKEESDLINPQESSTPELDKTLATGLGAIQTGVEAVGSVVRPVAGAIAETPAVKAAATKIEGVIDSAALSGLESVENMGTTIKEKVQNVAGQEQREEMKAKVSDAADEAKVKAKAKYDDVSEQAKEKAQEAKVKAKAKYDDVSEQAKEKAQEAKSKAKDTYDDAAEKTKAKAQEAKSKAKDTYEDAAEQTKEKAQEAKSKAKDTYEDGRESAKDTADNLKYKAQNTKESAKKKVA